MPRFAPVIKTLMLAPFNQFPNLAIDDANDSKCLKILFVIRIYCAQNRSKSSFFPTRSAHVNSMLGQFFACTNPRKHQDLWRSNCTCAFDHFGRALTLSMYMAADRKLIARQSLMITGGLEPLCRFTPDRQQATNKRPTFIAVEGIQRPLVCAIIIRVTL